MFNQLNQFLQIQLLIVSMICFPSLVLNNFGLCTFEWLPIEAPFGRAPGAAPTPAPAGVVPNGCKWSSSIPGAAPEAGSGLHRGGGATETWLHAAPLVAFLSCPQPRARGMCAEEASSTLGRLARGGRRELAGRRRTRKRGRVEWPATHAEVRACGGDGRRREREVRRRPAAGMASHGSAR